MGRAKAGAQRVRSRLALGAAALVVAGIGFATVSVAGGGNPVTAPEVSQMRVELERAAGGGALVATTRKPRIVYLQGADTVDSADPAVGPYVNVTLSAPACKGRGRVLGGGVAPSNTDVFQQGAYVVPGRGEYHVLLGFDDAAVEAGPVAYEITSHLICAKGVK